MQTRVKIGVTGINKLLGGGLPRPSNTLLLGVPGSGKTIFARQVIYSGLKEYAPCIYLCTSTTPSQTIDEMMRMGMNITPYLDDHIRFVDCFSWKLGPEYQYKSKYQLEDPRNLTKLLIVLTEAEKDINFKNGFFVFDSVSELLMHSDLGADYKLLELLMARLKESNAIGVFIIEEGMHPEPVVTTINYLCDNLIKLDLDKGDKYLSIKKMSLSAHFTKRVKFSVTKKGITLHE